MKKIVVPLLLITALLLSACGTSAAEPTAAPTAVPTTETETTGGEEATPAVVSASEENPCISFSILGQILTSPYPDLPEVTQDDRILGPFDAPVTFMEYSEPQCPYCAQLEPIITAFQALYPDDVRVVFRYRPFQESFHDKSILGSQAMEAAGMQGKFQEFKNWLFERQSKNPNNPAHANLADSEFWVAVAPDQFDEWLAARVPELGIDPDQFLEDMFSDAVVEKIAAAKASADQLAINGTPTLFVNGYPFEESWAQGTGIFSVYTELLLHQEKEFKTCPDLLIDTAKSYTASIETTQGIVKVELLDDIAPYAVNSFIFLADQGWYQDLPIITNDELVLSGDPTGTGYGGPGYIYKDEVSSDLNFSQPGMLATYALGQGLNWSTFFINKASIEGQSGRTIFGKVIEGMDLVNSLTTSDSIIKITITES